MKFIGKNIECANGYISNIWKTFSVLLGIITLVCIYCFFSNAHSHWNDQRIKSGMIRSANKIWKKIRIKSDFKYHTWTVRKWDRMDQINYWQEKMYGCQEKMITWINRHFQVRFSLLFHKLARNAFFSKYIFQNISLRKKKAKLR